MRDQDAALAGFLLPGIIHEFKNISNRINLLAEYGLSAPVDSVQDLFVNIKEEISSEPMQYIASLSAAPWSWENDQKLGSKVAHLPDDLETMYRILRSSARSAGFTLTFEDTPDVTIAGSALSVGLSFARLVCQNIGNSIEAGSAVIGFKVLPKAFRICLSLNSVVLDQLEFQLTV